MKRYLRISIVCLLAVAIILPVWALTKDWSFSNASNYTYDTGKIEVTGGSAQLKTNFFNTSWLYRKAITIYNTTNSNKLEEYQVEINIDSSDPDFWSHVKSDGGDIRFSDADGSTLLDYYLESFDYSGQSATIWVKTQTIEASSTRTIYIYYGNASSTSNSSIEATFSYSTLRSVAYVVSNNLAGATLNVVSLADNNQVYNGTSTLNLNDQDTGNFGAAELSQGTALQAKKLFHADEASAITDMVSPVSWAGTEFYYYSQRYTNTFHLLSPWGTANITIYDNGTSVYTGTVDSSGTVVSQDIGNGDVVRISSDIPILAQHVASGDGLMYYPATTAYLYGVPGNYFEIGSGASGANVSWVQSDGTTGSTNFGANGGSSTNVGGAQGTANAYRVKSSNNAINVNQLADGDGGDGTTFLPYKELGTVFGSANIVEYIAIAAPNPSTVCTLYNNAGGQVSQQTGGTRTDVNKILFSGLSLAGGWKLVTDQPVFAYYEKDGPDDETNLMSYKQMRQFTYPTPTLEVSSTEETTYASDDPTVQPGISNFQSFTSLSSFEETATKNGGEIKYLLSNDQGTTWKYYSGGWIDSDGTYSQANTASEINSNLASFPVGDGKLLFKAFLHSDGSQLVQLDNLTVEYSIVPGVSVVVHLTAQPQAGDSSVFLKAAFDEANPDQNLFYAATNGGDYGSATAGQSDTADPPTQEVSLGLTLDGNDYINKIKCLHINDLGGMVTNESTSPNVAYKYVKPYKPSFPTVSNATANSVNVVVNKNPGEAAGLEYAIYVSSHNKYVQADGSLADPATWESIAGWGTKIVTGLGSPETYVFKVKSRNTSDTDHLSYSESELSFGSSAGGPAKPLQVDSYYPSAETVGISPEVNVQVIFNRDMNIASVQGSFSMEAIYDNQGNEVDTPVSGPFSWVGSLEVTFDPSASLNKGCTYQVRISKEAQDSSGNTMSGELAWTFTTIMDHSSQNVFYSSDAKAEVSLSADALSADGSIDINRDPLNDPKEVDPNAIIIANNKVTAEGDVYRYALTSSLTEFNIYDASGTRITETFSAPVTVTLYYLDENDDGFVDSTSPAVQERGLIMYRLDETNGLWVKVPGSSVNTTLNNVSAAVPSFSVYTLMATPALALSDAYVFPNPFKPSDGHTQVTFTNLASVCTIKIFTLTGELVKTIVENDGDAQAAWNVKNEAGQNVASGLYLFFVKSAQDQKKGKLVIIR